MRSLDNRDPGNRREAWGKRVLLATVPQNAASYLKTYTPKNRDTVVDTGKFPRTTPIHVEVRFADPSLNNGAPILPFSTLCPAVNGNDVVLTLTIRRGLDLLAPITTDVYTMPVGLNNGVNDRVSFDIITCDGLGIDVELSGNTNPNSALWVEVVATPVDYPSPMNLVGGYLATIGGGPQAYFAQPLSVLLAPLRAARKQLIITNTSLNADLLITFGPVATVGTYTIALPKNNPFARYEGPVGGYCGPVSGIWDALLPTGVALVTEGINI